MGMKKDKFARFMSDIEKIQSEHKLEIDGSLKDYFSFQGKNGIPLIWEKQLQSDIKQKIILSAFKNLSH
jgi:hypothetical protein